jgi:hypothetical protein
MRFRSWQVVWLSTEAAVSTELSQEHLSETTMGTTLQPPPKARQQGSMMHDTPL